MKRRPWTEALTEKTVAEEKTEQDEKTEDGEKTLSSLHEAVFQPINLRAFRCR